MNQHLIQLTHKLHLKFDNTLFEFDDNRRLTNTGQHLLNFDIEGKTATVKLNSKDYKFSDGQPLTIDDYIFAIEAIGNKDYTGVRYNGNYQNIEGNGTIPQW